MGIDDFLGAIGNGIEKINKWTSLAPSGVEQKPLLSIGEEGVSVRDPLETFRVAPAGEQVQAQGFNRGLEHTMSGLRWLYSNAVSQPLTTTVLALRRDDMDVFTTKNWTDSWRAAEHISPGQSVLLDDPGVERAINSPLLYYKPPEAYLPPGFSDLPQEQQQEILRQAGMPAVGNAFIEKQRGNSGWFKYGSGAIDFASVMFLDPTILGGKAAGAAVRARTISRAPAGGWSTAQIDELMARTNTQRLMQGIWANRNNPQLLNNTALALHSGMGPRFGSIVSRLQNEDELALFVRTGMGDVRAMQELGIRNAAIDLRMTSDLARVDHLNLQRSAWANQPKVVRVIDNELQRLNRQVNADGVMAERYSEILRQRDLLDQLHVSRWSLQRAEDRTIAQNAYLAGPARGNARQALTRGMGRNVTIRPSAGPVQVGSGARYRPTPIDLGYVHTRLWGVGDFFTAPVTLIRSLKNMHPNGYMSIGMNQSAQELKNSLTELRGQLARIPNIKQGTRARIMNEYTMATTEAARLAILEDVGRLGAARIAEKYGLDATIGQQLYREHLVRKQGELARMRTALDPDKRYSAGRRPEAEVVNLRSQYNLPDVPYATDPLSYIDTFVTQDGQIVALEPFTVTRLVNGHTFMDLDTLDKVLRRNSGKVQTLHRASGSAKDAIESLADSFTQLWKFTTLFRLGYIPRVLGDDLASQWARAGTAAMAVRASRGSKNLLQNGMRYAARPGLRLREENARIGASYALDEIKTNIAPNIKSLERTLRQRAAADQAALPAAQRRHVAAQAKVSALNPTDQSAKARATRSLAQKRLAQLNALNARIAAGPSPGKTAALRKLQDRRDFLQRYADLQTRAADDYLTKQQKVIQGNQPFDIDGQPFPAAFGGREGEYYKAQVSADDSVGNLFNTNKQMLQGNLERSFDHGAKPISATQNAQAHLEAWTHAINNVIMQDAMQMQFVRGATVPEVMKWMRGPEGQAYRRRLPKMVDTEDLVQSAKYEVDQYLHTPELRMKALEPDGVSPAWLEKAFPNRVARPDVHIGQMAANQGAHIGTLATVRDWWFRTAATIPADRMSRHPLFNQFYEGHLKRIAEQQRAQLQALGTPPVQVGRRKPRVRANFSVEEIEKMASAARQLALRDTRELVFDIAHRSDAAAATRFMSPFFAATSESFQRWGRVIAARPEVVGYAANWYNSPAYRGSMQDLDGNHIDGEGYTYIPIYPLNPDGSVNYNAKPRLEKRLVPKSERYIVTRVPKWVAESPLGKAFNITEAGGQLSLSQNSMNMVTQGDPFFNPGVGPVVQIPVNEFVKDKPRTAEVAREIGILPFGPVAGGAFGDTVAGRAMAQISPKTVRDFLTAFDTTDERYQRIKLQIVQREVFEFDRVHDEPPNAQQMAAIQKRAAEKTRDYWMFSASSAFLQPMATQRHDPYQFFRDQYMALRRQNPLTADDEYLKRYGESHFIFAQEASRSYSVPPTMKAVELTQEFQDLISAHPEFAGLIVGPEGNGPFSREAYAYQLNTPIVPGGAEMQRTRLSADEALKENQKRLGWAKFTSRMNDLNARLRTAGFGSFSDEGAEDFAAEKKAWVSVYGEPLMPDGSVNPYYNEAWSEEFFTTDQRKYDRRVAGLTQLARSRLADLPERSDLRTLQLYLGARQALRDELATLKAADEPHTLGAEANSDLRARWVSYVDSLIERDTRFGDLYHRYLSRDMDVDVEEEAGLMEEAQ